MRVAALYDIHGNLPALEAVLQEVHQAGVDHLIIGGDVFPGPMPLETLTRLLTLPLPVQFLRGNGDREVLAQRTNTETDWYRTAPELWREPVRWTAQQLLPEHVRLLATWPATLRISLPGVGEVLFCHATPRNDTEIFTHRTPEAALLPLFAGLEVSCVVCGHTHLPFDRMVGKVRVLNAGSVGMPFGKPGASWLLLDSEVQIRHTSYDLVAAAERIRATAYPQAHDFATNNILNPPTEAAVLEAYARAEIREESL